MYTHTLKYKQQSDIPKQNKHRLTNLPNSGQRLSTITNIYTTCVCKCTYHSLLSIYQINMHYADTPPFSLRHYKDPSETVPHIKQSTGFL
jgi:hypothetical protein